MIYEFTDYKRFLNTQIASLPKKGRGQARKISEHLGVHSVVISQILSGDRDFTHEQALEVAQYFGLDERATIYFSTLVLKARAGTKKLKDHLEGQLEKMREEALDLKNRLSHLQELKEEDKAIFFSDWTYTAILLATSIKGLDNIDAIAQRFQMDRPQVAKILEYLVASGLAVQDGRGSYKHGEISPFLAADSPYITNHHRSWRLKAQEKMSVRKPHDYFLSLTTVISQKTKEQIREELINVTTKINQQIDNSSIEKLTCLNIDWFDF
ncbi:MAG: TIGR02147 family protein [Pseudobdellovibrionaceae bacterium]